MNDTPLNRNAQPVPTEAMTMPATAGPIMRAALNEVEFSAIAFGQIRIAHQFGHECLAHWCIERRGAAEQESERIDVPELHPSGDGQNPEDKCERAHRRLSSHQQFALVEMIGGKSGPLHQQELWSELKRHDDADGGRTVMRELGENEPILGGALHPGPDVGHQAHPRAQTR